MISNKHWGELEHDDEINIPTTDKKDGKSEKFKLNLNNFELPPLYQPITNPRSSKKEWVLYVIFLIFNFLSLVFFNSKE